MLSKLIQCFDGRSVSRKGEPNLQMLMIVRISAFGAS